VLQGPRKDAVAPPSELAYVARPTVEEAASLDPRRYLELAPRAPEGAVDLRALWQGSSADIELEIGFGRGMFLLERAKSAPHVRLLGIEIKSKWAYLVAERARRESLEHVRVFGGDAREILPRLGPEASLTRVFVHFPDPWWKKRHAKRRLRGPSTLEPIARLLAPGGELFIQTDVEDRAQDFVSDIRAHGGFEIGEPPFVPDQGYGARSNREKRAIADELPIYRVLAHRI
jgi:tRNA (guanine-N7-)-methyltransferase